MRFILLALAVLLIIAWLCAFVFLHVAGTMIHLLLLFAIIAFIVHFVSRPTHAWAITNQSYNYSFKMRGSLILGALTVFTVHSEKDEFLYAHLAPEFIHKQRGVMDAM